MVEPAPAADVEVPVRVFGDDLRIVARQPLRRRIRDEGRPLRPSVVDANEPAARGREPDAAGPVHMDVHDRAWRQSLAFGEQRESTLRVAAQPTIETNPHLT